LPPRRIRFNPILVQFKLFYGDGLPDANLKFQSYLSPIQTQASSIRALQGIMCFNPILVQFKPTGSARNDIPRPCFNPILVQFKPRRTGAIPMPDPVFQSYLSPIQTVTIVTISCTSLKFQSYLSPIQTLLRAAVCLHRVGVSILS